MGVLSDSIGGGASITVETESGDVSLTGISTLKVPDGTLTDNTTSASMTYPQINGTNLDSFSANLVSSWSFDEASGVIDDAQPGAHDLTISGTLTYSQASLRGTAISGGSSPCAYNSDAGLTPGTGDFTLSLWHYSTSLSNPVVMALGNAFNSSTTMVGLHFNSASVFLLGNGRGTLATIGSKVLANTWQLWTLARTSAVWKVLLNGVEILSTATQGTKDITDGHLGFFSWASNNYQNSSTRLSNATYYDSYLSSAALTEMYNLGSGVMVGDPTPPTPPSATQLDLVADRLFANYGCADNSPLSDDYLGQHDITLLAGVPTNTTGKNGNCVSLDATTSYTVADTEKSFSKGFGGAVGDDFSISFWLNVSSFATARRGILGFATSPTVSTVAKGISVEVTTGALRFDGNAGTALITGSALSTSTWHHVVMVFDTAGTPAWRLYLDGSADGTSTAENTQDLSTIDFHVGRIFNLYGNGGGTTLLDEAQIWKTALNATAVSELYNSGAGRFSS